MADLDVTRLLAYLRARAEHPDPIVYAVLTGMAARIERGDFDKDNN
jgi:hypothetical protein